MFRNKTRKILVLVLLFNISFAGMCEKNDTRTRTLAKATDDFAEGQKSAAKLLATARDNGTISPEDIQEIKPFLLQANELNAEAIKFGRALSLNPNDVSAKENLVATINLISVALVRANNAGLIKIKNKETQVAFSIIVTTMQAAVTSAITILKN